MGLIIPGGGSFVPQEVQDRLKKIDPRMKIVPKQTLKMDSGADGDRTELQWVWNVALGWPENDPRWRMVQVGQVDPEMAFDLLTQIPPDCPIEQIPGYLARHLTRRNGHPGKICDEVAAWNKDQSIRNGEVVSEFAAELFDANKSTILAGQGVVAPKPVYQHNPAQTGKKNQPKEA